MPLPHSHHHCGSPRDYFTEQLLTILVCGLFGFAAIQMYRNGALEFLAPQFRLPVLVGGAAILLLVFIRAIAVWKEAGAYQATGDMNAIGCGQDHTHDANCNHTLYPEQPEVVADPDADDGHSHDMSWTFARMLILVFPVLLFFMGLPNASLSKERQLAMAGNDAAMGSEMLKDLAKDAVVVDEKTLDGGVIVRELKTRTGLKIRETIPSDGGEPKLEIIAGEGSQMRFNDLNDAAFDERKRQSLEGQTAILEGRFKRLADKEFSLFRFKMTCCAADTVPLKVRIIVPQALGGFNDFDWVQAKGTIQFLQLPGQDRYVPVLLVADITDVRKTVAKNEYEQ